MALPQWTLVHSFKEFLQLMEEYEQQKERNMTNVDTTTYNPDVALEALNALNAAEANLADAVYADNGSELKLATPAAEYDAGEDTKEGFEQEALEDGIVLN